VVAYCLKIPAYQEQIDFVVVSRLETNDMLVNRVQLPVATSFNCNLLIVRCGGGLVGLELAFILKIAGIEVEPAEGSITRSITHVWRFDKAV